MQRYASVANSPAKVYERRSDPRIVVDLPVVLRSGERSCRGRTCDASAGGLLVELHEPLSFIGHEVGVQITMVGGGMLVLEADVVRRALSAEGRVLLALKLLVAGGPRALLRRAGTRPCRDYSKRVQRSRAKPREPRPPRQARAELRALGRRALERAIVEPDARAPSSLVRWTRSLAEELGSTGPPSGTTNRELVRSVVRLHRDSVAGEGALADS